MNKMLVIILVLTALTISCRSKRTPILKVANHGFLDTIIYIDSLNFLSETENNRIPYDTAQKALKDYFYKLAYYNEKDSATSRWDRGDIWCADIDTVWPAHLNGDKFIDAVIEYQDAPCRANGHCIMPHKAIVAYINGKYRFLARDFIPSNYFIDSIRVEKGFQIIYGDDYDCGEHETVRKFRAQITPLN